MSELKNFPCEICSGDVQHMGTLGSRFHYRCRNCGLEFSRKISDHLKKVKAESKKAKDFFKSHIIVCSIPSHKGEN
jgi:transposase-like protein